MRWRVDSDRGTCRLTTSARPNSSDEGWDEALHAGGVPGRVEHIHVEALGAPSHRLSDPPEPDQAERCAVHVSGQVRAEPPPIPATPPKVGLCSGGLPGGRQNQQEREVGGRLAQYARGVADRDAQGGGRGNVDVVVAHRRIGDDPETSRATRTQDVGIHPVGEVADDPVELGSQPGQCAGGRRDVVVEHLDVVPRLVQRVGPPGDERSRNQDAAHITPDRPGGKPSHYSGVDPGVRRMVWGRDATETLLQGSVGPGVRGRRGHWDGTCGAHGDPGAAGDAGAALRQTTTSAPGVSAHSITVGTISTQTGTLAANFSSLVYGERAYFNYVNGRGGVNGRRIDYRYALDDGGNPTSFNQLANTIINQDHVFAVTGVATAFFSPNLFVEAGIPTYGYDVTGNWADEPNLFAAGGSVQFYPSSGLYASYVARKSGSHSVAILAYGVPASSDACQASQNALKAAGIDVSYSDLNVPYPGSTVATDVERIKRAGSTMVVSCMDVKGNLTLARAIEQYGLKATQLWYSGDDQSTLDQNQGLMQNVYFSTNHVPFTAPTSLYPGLKVYLTQMKKYEPKYVSDEIAIEGWESAALFVQGVKLAGNDLTRKNVIRAEQFA